MAAALAALLLAFEPASAQAPPPVATSPAASQVPPAPPEIGASKAYATLDRHCARCHQTGKLQDALPAGGIGNILALNEIARDPSLVRPGVPDASRLYTSILGHRMPLDFVRTGQGGPEPTADEIHALREWIADLPAGRAGVCTGRRRISPEDVAGTIEAAITQAPPEEAKQHRFVSLANLYNVCMSDAELEGFRQGITTLVNSLSWGPAPVRLEAIGEEKVLLKVVLSDIGWIGAHWEQLVASYPLRAAPAARLPQAVIEATGTRVPVLNGDWLADAAMKPPLYYDLLGLPGRFSNLQRILRLDPESNIRRGLARRAGILLSRETTASRILERHAAPTGAMWLSYDFAGNTGRQSLVEHPLGPTATDVMRVPFRHDGMKALFHLPNGFTAFSLNDIRGDRLDRTPAELDKDRFGISRPLTSGAACLQCHLTGPIGAKDELRALVDNERTATRELKDSVAALHAPEAEMSALFEADVVKTRAALQAAGIDPALHVWGLDPLRALVQANRRPVDLARAAADFGVEPEALRQRLANVTGENAVIARVLRQDIVRRDAVDRVLAELSASPDRAAAAPSPQAALAPPDALDLSLWSDADVYDAGQAAAFFAQASQDCYLTLVDVDRSGRATVLFPNEFEQSNLITANRERRVPGQDAPYRFRLKERGRETVVGICSKTQRSPDGITHDFERLRFTVLGDWQIFLREPPALDEARRDDAAQDRPRPQQRRARPKASEPAKAAPSSGPDMQARTAIVIDVR